MKDQFIGMNLKQKVRIKVPQTSVVIFLNQTLYGLTDCFLVYLNRGNDVTRYSAKKYYLPKSIVKKYSVIINGKNLYD